MDIAKKERVGHWEFRLLTEKTFNGNIRWIVERVKMEGDDQGRFREVYGPYDLPAEAIDVADWPKPKTEVEELWEWAKAARELLSQSQSYITSGMFCIASGMFCDELSRHSKSLIQLEAKWKTNPGR